MPMSKHSFAKNIKRELKIRKRLANCYYDEHIIEKVAGIDELFLNLGFFKVITSQKDGSNHNDRGNLHTIFKLTKDGKHYSSILNNDINAEIPRFVNPFT